MKGSTLIIWLIKFYVLFYFIHTKVTRRNAILSFLLTVIGIYIGDKATNRYIKNGISFVSLATGFIVALFFIGISFAVSALTVLKIR